MRNINSVSRGNALNKTGATYYHAQLGLRYKGRAIKGLDVCNDWNLALNGPILLTTVP